MKVAMGAAEGSGALDALVRFMRRVSDDFRHKELMPIKVLFFVQSSTLFVLYPFLTIHMKELGIGVQEAAAMNALSPFIAVLMPPLAGLVADRIGNFRVLLSILSAVGGGVSLLLLLVPPARHHPPFPSTLTMVMLEADTGFSPGGGFFVQPLPEHLPCTFPEHKDGVHPLVLTLSHCGHSCPIQNLTEADFASAPNGTFAGKLSETRVFLPDDFSVGFGCDPNCTLRRPPGGRRPQRGRALFIHASLNRKSDPNATITFMLEGMTSAERGGRNESDPSEEPGDDQDLETGGSDVVSAWIAAYGDGPAELCQPACLVTTPREGVCMEKFAPEAVTNNPKLTFWSYLAIRVLIGAIGGTAFAMFEGAVIALLRRHGADYGLQRIYAAIGAMIASPLSGLLLDAGGATDFRPAFYLYASLKVISGLLVLTIDLEFKSPAKRVVKEVVTALRNWELVTILVAALALGAAWGFLEGFLFWLLQDLGATKMLMGLTVTVGGAAGLPLLALAGPITDRIGHHAVIAISFLVYAIRLLGYSLLVNPWLCLIFEAMEGVTSSLAVTACVTAVASRSTTSTDSSLQGLLGGIYYGVGRGIGSLVGGLLMGALGSKETFRLFSGMCAGVGVVYLWMSRGAFGRRPSKKGSEEEATTAAKDAGEKKLKEAEEGTREAGDERCRKAENGDVKTAKDGEPKTDESEKGGGPKETEKGKKEEEAKENEAGVDEKFQSPEEGGEAKDSEGHVNLALQVDDAGPEGELKAVKAEVADEKVGGVAENNAGSRE
ncbi:major facilitator superfamily domain-containing protein 6-like [Hetaerina americana]|uniref:major facilitator superfamily domain-containing protein 6-like n=1 Tax=Hetaerina americana TaxID=62018 RepID=UPI003A7F5B03